MSYLFWQPVCKPSITRRTVLTTIFASLLAPKVVTAASSDQSTNLMDAFWVCYNANRGVDLETRVAALNTTFLRPHIAFYIASIMHGGPIHLMNSFISQWLTRVDGRVSDIHAMAEAIQPAWQEHEPRFRKVFPEAITRKLTIMPSIGCFNAKPGRLDGAETLFAAPDGMVLMGNTIEDLPVTLDHEAFHLYQHQVNQTINASYVWGRLWSEGLAQYVSQRLNPYASQSSIMMSMELAQASPQDIAAGTELARKAFESTDQTALQTLFAAMTHDTLPPRIGYLVGLRAVEKISGNHTLDELARMPADRVRPILYRALCC